MTTRNAIVADVGDHVLVRGRVALVLDVRVFEPGRHPSSPISNHKSARCVVTEAGERWTEGPPVSRMRRGRSDNQFR